jgi:DNA-binding MarR family transcriptional regulator
MEASNSDLALALYELHRMIAERSDSRFFLAIEASGLGATELKTLMALHHMDAPVSLSTLADTMSRGLPMISRAVQALCKRGLVASSVAEHDRRGREIALSPDGTAMIEAILRARLEDLEHVVSGLPEELTVTFTPQLVSFLTSISHDSPETTTLPNPS